ncbi:MAG: heme peroxidase family protein [Acidobacteriota bacterium]
MSHISHGQIAPFSAITQDNLNIALPSSPSAPANPAFDYLFQELQNDQNALKALLPVTQKTVPNLKRLGRAMCEDNGIQPRHSTIPSLYTYFGQFLDHEITFFDAESYEKGRLHNPNLVPLPPEVILTFPNKRTPRLDLDCIYGQSEEENNQLRDGDRMRLGTVTHVTDRLRPAGKDGDEFDLLRKVSQNPAENRAANIGDGRNDENLIIAQMHVAFLRAHNTLVEQLGFSYDKANLALRQHFQWVVLHDFLKRIANAAIVDRVLNQVLANDPARFYQPSAGKLFMPLEFSAAAYRFGHSMVRDAYRLNSLFDPIPLGQLFTRTALKGTLPAGGPAFDTMPESWIIEWGDFIDGGQNRARRIGTRLTNHLAKLRDSSGNPLINDAGQPLADEAMLSVRNLLRGYLLRIPTGQAVAEKLGMPPMSASQIEKAVGPAQAEILHETELSTHTPLWYYILAEVDNQLQGNPDPNDPAHSNLTGPDHLGPVGSTIVAEVLIELVRHSKDSILQQPGWRPSLGKTPGWFTLPDLLKLGGVLSKETLLPIPDIVPLVPSTEWPGPSSQ